MKLNFKFFLILFLIISLLFNIFLIYSYILKSEESQLNYNKWQEFKKKYELEILEKERSQQEFESQQSENLLLVQQIHDVNNEINLLESQNKEYNNNINEIELNNYYEEQRLKNTYEYKELTKDVSIKVDKWTYTQYRNKERYSLNEWKDMIYESLNEDYIDTLFEELEEVLDKNSKGDISNSELIKFVQEFSYYNDIETGKNEYPKYPIETLWDQGGDCEDSSILLSTLIAKNGYGVALIDLPNHMAVGIYCDPQPGQSYYEVDGKEYCYIETTAEGWDIGEIPSKYDGDTAKLYII